MEPECSIPHSHVPTICPYPQPDQSNSCPKIPLFEHPPHIVLPSTPGTSKLSLSLRYPHQNLCTHLPSLPYALHAQPISFFSIWSPEQYWVRSTDHSALHYVVLSIPSYLYPLRPGYSLQHPILKHPQPTFLPQRK